MSDSILYFLSSDIDLEIKVLLVGVANLDVTVPLTKRLTPTTMPTEREMFITCDTYLHGALSVVRRVRSTYKSFPYDRDMIWNEWLTLPLKYKDSLKDTSLVFTIWDACSSRPLAGTTIRVFAENGTVRFGFHKMRLWTDRSGHVYETPFDEGLRLSPLEENIHKFSQKPMPRVGWLDRLLLPVMEKLELVSPEDGPMLLIEFPDFPYPIVYDAKICNPGVPDFADAARLCNPVSIRTFYDPEIERSNPIDDKFQALSHSWSGAISIKPRLSERDQLQNIIASPSKILHSSEKALLWRFRHYLTDDKHALVKFLRCVNWDDTYEVQQGVSLLEKWTQIEISDALELLSAFVVHPQVRQYAVECLNRADDSQLQMFLLQLVQALRFEKVYPSDLSRFLIRRCSKSINMATYMHWFVHVEQTAANSSQLFDKFQEDFMNVLKSNEDSHFHEIVTQQHQFCDHLLELASALKNRTYKAQREKLLSLIAGDGPFNHLKSFQQPVCLPILPQIFVTGLLEVDIFKSSMAPFSLLCSTTSGVSYRVMFKNGDDLRQDQLIIQMINLVDQLLKRVNLDLRLSPYRVLATSTGSGFVELVPDCKNLRAILSEYGASNNAIRLYFETMCNNNESELSSILDCFVKSCAGYCVITYIFGIGDRHLDNLLLTKQGHLFHIDFGFAFGRDPKPFPPPMKLCKEMVEAMGGSKSSHYRAFEAYCCQAFNILRKSAPLILNLLSLMADSGIQDLSADVAEKNLIKVQDKFRLDLTDEEAEQVFLNLITESVTALFPIVIDRIHNWALYWK